MSNENNIGLYEKGIKKTKLVCTQKNNNKIIFNFAETNKDTIYNFSCDKENVDKIQCVILYLNNCTIESVAPSKYGFISFCNGVKFKPSLTQIQIGVVCKNDCVTDQMDNGINIYAIHNNKITSDKGNDSVCFYFVSLTDQEFQPQSLLNTCFNNILVRSDNMYGLRYAG